MAKKTKKLPMKKKNRTPWKVLWIGFGFFAVTVTLLTSAQLYLSKQTSVLGTTDGFKPTDPCLHVQVGTGWYCGQVSGASGNPSTRYWCSCSHGKCSKTRQEYCSYGCQHNPNPYPDTCKAKSAKKQTKNSSNNTSNTKPKITGVKLSATCDSHINFHIHVSWNANFTSKSNFILSAVTKDPKHNWSYTWGNTTSSSSPKDITDTTGAGATGWIATVTVKSVQGKYLASSSQTITYPSCK